MSRNPATTSANLGINKSGVGINYKSKESAPTFPFGCKYCGRANVCSRAGNSCGRSTCNSAWTKDNAGLKGVGKRIERVLS